MMSDKRAVSIHMGANRVATEITDCMSDALIEYVANSSTRIIPRREYVQYFRSAIVASNRIGLEQASEKPILDGISSFDRFQHIVLSEHALLGNMSELFSKQRMLPKAKRRAENIARAFADCEINLHLAIAPQSDCWASILADEKLLAGLANNQIPVHSWSDLVSRVTAGCPSAKLTVWDFEQPDQASHPFLASLLGLEPDYVDILTEAKLDLRACSQLKKAKTLSKVIQIDEQFQTRMDVQYEIDLTAIEAMPSVSLVRS